MPSPVVNVKNNGLKDFEQRFKDNLIVIPKGKCVKMKRSDAVAFLGMLSPVDPNDSTKVLIKNLEIIPLDETDGQPDEPEKFVCHVDGKVCETEEELNEYIKKFEDQRIKKEPEDEKGNEAGGLDGLLLLKCPVCNKEGIKGKQGLKVHLSQYCKG